MAAPGFWDDQQAAQKVISKANRLKALVQPVHRFREEIADLEAMLELVEETTGDEAGEYIAELITMVEALLPKMLLMLYLQYTPAPAGLRVVIGRRCSCECTRVGVNGQAMKLKY
jgi:hypothetical protein